MHHRPERKINSNAVTKAGDIQSWMRSRERLFLTTLCPEQVKKRKVHFQEELLCKHPCFSPRVRLAFFFFFFPQS